MSLYNITFDAYSVLLYKIRAKFRYQRNELRGYDDIIMGHYYFLIFGVDLTAEEL